jgi:hypothetical protein
MNNTTQLIHANTTGIASADMYRMSDKFSWWLADIGLPLDGLRLFHGLLHQTCRNLPGWSENVRQDDDGHMVSSMALKTQLGLGRAKSNRNIKHGISALRDTDCFDWIEFRHGTEWVTWRFTDEALAAILENNIYALLDAKGLSTTNNPTDFHIFSLVALHRRMRKPEFRLSIGQMQPWVDGVDADWSALRRPFLTALQRACATYNLTAVVLMKCTGTLRGIDQVVIRTRMPGNLWTVDELAKTGRYARKCMVVGPRSFLTCGPKKLHSTLSHLKAAHWDVDRIKPT